jgi:cytochrome b6-f complex iron-sulfur subunit
MSEPEEKHDSDKIADEAAASLTRRTALGAAVGVFSAGYAGAIGYPIYRYVNTPAARAEAIAAVTEVSLDGASTLKPGDALPFMFGNRPSVLIHHQDDTWSAFDAVCTHLGCTVKYEPGKDRIFCACHGGVYNANSGEPEAGPPPRALTKYTVEVKDDQVVVSRG